MKELQVKYLNDHARELVVAKEGDCGLDLVNASGQDVVVPVGRSVEIEAGLAVKLPDGYCGFIRSRSSTFKKRGLFVIEGVIDSGYVGPLYTLVWNPGMNGNLHPVTVRAGERLSQLIVLPYARELDVSAVDDLPDTERGASGFGSTGL